MEDDDENSFLCITEEEGTAFLHILLYDYSTILLARALSISSSPVTTLNSLPLGYSNKHDKYILIIMLE